MSADENKPKRTRRSSEEVAAEKAAKAAEKEAREAAKAAEKEAREAAKAEAVADDGQMGDVAFDPAAEPVPEHQAAQSVVSVKGVGGADGVLICNSGRQNEVIILNGVRKFLAPMEIWRVPAELMPALEKYMKTPYFQSVEASGILTVSGAVTGKMKDPDMRAVRTPKPPVSINPEVQYGGKTTTVEMTMENA